MGVSSLIPTAYFVTPKSKQLAKTNSNGLVLNTFDSNYQAVTISIGTKTVNNYTVNGFNTKLSPSGYTATYVSPIAYRITPPAWVNDGTIYSMVFLNTLYGAATNNNIIIDGKNVIILCVYWLVYGADITQFVGLHTLNVVLDKFVGDQIIVFYKNKLFVLSCELAYKANDGTWVFQYVSADVWGGGYLESVGFEKPTGSITLYFSKFSKLIFRNPEAALPAILGGPYTPGAPWSPA